MSAPDIIIGDIDVVLTNRDAMGKLRKAAVKYHDAVRVWSLKARAVTEDRNVFAGKVYEADKALLAAIAESCGEGAA